MRKSDNIASLELLAASQWGMFTTAQAQALGVRRIQVSRMASSLRVEPVCYGVYRFTTGAQPAQADIKAEWLSVFPKQAAAERLAARPHDAVLAGRSAACALGAGDFHASPYTFIVARRRQTSRHDVRFLQCKLDGEDIVLCDGIPTTSFERTVYDLLRLDEDPDLVDKFMQDAARRQNHAFDGKRLGTLLSPIASRYGFPAGDGKGLAADLIARNAAVVQMERAVDNIGQALAAFADRTPGQSTAQLEGISSAISEMARALGAIAPAEPGERPEQTSASTEG